MKKKRNLFRKKGSKYSIDELIKLHERLSNKHLKRYKKLKNDDAESYIKHGYHFAVANELRLKNRRLTKDEKAKLYKSARYYYFN